MNCVNAFLWIIYIYIYTTARRWMSCSNKFLDFLLGMRICMILYAILARSFGDKTRTGSGCWKSVRSSGSGKSPTLGRATSRISTAFSGKLFNRRTFFMLWHLDRWTSRAPRIPLVLPCSCRKGRSVKLQFLFHWKSHSANKKYLLLNSNRKY